MVLYALLSLTAVIINIMLGTYVMLRNPKHSGAKIFGLMMVCFVIFAFGEFGKRILPMDASNHVIFLDRISWIGISLVGGVFLYLALMFPRRNEILDNKITYIALFLPSIIFLYFVWATDLLITGTHNYYWGMGTTYSDLFIVFAIIFELYLLVGLYLFYRIYKKTTSKTEKVQSVMILIGAAIPIVGGTVTNVIFPAFGLEIVPLLSLFLTFSGIFIAYAIIKYKLLILEPITEPFVVPGPIVELDKGYTYLISEEKPVKSYQLFIDLVKSGSNGLFITTNNPNKIKERYGLEKTPFIWVTHKGKGENWLKPMELLDDNTASAIKNFLEKSKDSVIIFDCLDYVSKKALNSIDKRYSLLERANSLCNAIVSNNSRLIMPVSEEMLAVESKEKIKTENAIPSLSLFNTLVFEKAVNSTVKSLLPIIGEEALRRKVEMLRDTTPLFSSIKYEDRRIAIDITKRLTKEDLMNYTRKWLLNFSDIKDIETSSIILNIFEKYGFCKAEVLTSQGTTYLVREEKPVKSYQMLKELTHVGYKGLCISRVKPKLAMEKYGLSENTTLYWLTKTKDVNIPYILPPEQDEISNVVTHFIRDEGKSVILIDGLEFFIDTFGFKPTLDLLYILRDEMAMSSARAIIPFSPGAIKSEELALLERELELL